MLVNKDETSTRRGAWLGLAAGAAVGAVFPPSILGAAALGGVIGGVSGHLAKGMSRSQAMELGEFIDPGEAGLLVVGETKVQEAITQSVTRATGDPPDAPMRSSALRPGFEVTRTAR